MPLSQENKSEFKQRALFLLSCAGLLWAIWFLDWLLPFVDLKVCGIRPRNVSGLVGIPCAPFLHGKWSHLLGNTIPLLVLGALVILRGYRHFFQVVAYCALFSGLGTWLFGSGGTSHIGASGIVFGFLGYLIARGFYEKKFASLLISAGVGIAYVGTILTLIQPEAGISWSGHFWGFLGGMLTARILHGKPKPKPEALAAEVD